MAGKVNNKGGGGAGAPKAAKAADAPKPAQATKQTGSVKAGGGDKAAGAGKPGDGAGKTKLSKDERKAFGVKGNDSVNIG